MPKTVRVRVNHNTIIDGFEYPEGTHPFVEPRFAAMLIATGNASRAVSETPEESRAINSALVELRTVPKAQKAAIR